MTDTLSIGNMDSLADILEGLQSLGYVGQLNEEGTVLTSAFGNIESDINIVLTVDEATNAVKITSPLAVLGQFNEESIPELFAEALRANLDIAPFAYSIVSDVDGDGEIDPAEQWPLVLTTSVPLGDFSLSELEYYISSLGQAISKARPVLQAGLLTEETVEA